jgi:hypothetical protein
MRKTMRRTTLLGFFEVMRAVVGSRGWKTYSESVKLDDCGELGREVLMTELRRANSRNWNFDVP